MAERKFLNRTWGLIKLAGGIALTVVSSPAFMFLAPIGGFTALAGATLVGVGKIAQTFGKEGSKLAIFGDVCRSIGAVGVVGGAAVALAPVVGAALVIEGGTSLMTGNSNNQIENFARRAFNVLEKSKAEKSAKNISVTPEEVDKPQAASVSSPSKTPISPMLNKMRKSIGLRSK